MKKKISIIGYISALFFIGSCADEDSLTPSLYDANWYVVEDSSDPLDHLRYTVFQATTVPIYYNDTIGRQDRGMDAFGNPTVYYEVLDPSYTINNSKATVSYVLSADRVALTAGVEFLRDRVLPNLLDPVIHPRSYLLVNTLTNVYGTVSRHYKINVYRGMMTTVVGNVNTIPTMNETSLHCFASEILAEEYISYLLEKHYDLLRSFFSVAWSEVYPGVNVYGKETTASTTPPYKPIGEYGFLDFDHGAASSSVRCTLPSDRADAVDFMTEVLIGDHEAFETKHAAYPFVLKKYGLMKEVLTNLHNVLK